MGSSVWLDPRFTETSCWTCGARPGDTCIVPGTVFPEQLTEAVPHPKRIEKMIEDGIFDKDELANVGEFPYTDYIDSLK